MQNTRFSFWIPFHKAMHPQYTFFDALLIALGPWGISGLLILNLSAAYGLACITTHLDKQE